MEGNVLFVLDSTLYHVLIALIMNAHVSVGEDFTCTTS